AQDNRSPRAPPARARKDEDPPKRVPVGAACRAGSVVAGFPGGFVGGGLGVVGGVAHGVLGGLRGVGGGFLRLVRGGGCVGGGGVGGDRGVVGGGLGRVGDFRSGLAGGGRGGVGALGDRITGVGHGGGGGIARLLHGGLRLRGFLLRGGGLVLACGQRQHAGGQQDGCDTDVHVRTPRSLFSSNRKRARSRKRSPLDGKSRWRTSDFPL